jgi:NAD(P)-dependent dehydrogenase (short-subunit alcohol dehydrogenase family)
LPHPWLLVTGSSGLIGTEVCSYFAGHGWQVVGLDNIHSHETARFIEAFEGASRVAVAPTSVRSWRPSRLPNTFVGSELCLALQDQLSDLQTLASTISVGAAAGATSSGWSSAASVCCMATSARLLILKGWNRRIG